MPYILLIIYFASSFLLQFLTGDFPATVLAFPLNLMLLLIWMISVAVLWQKGKKSSFIRFMLSPGASISALGAFLAFCIAVGMTGWRWVVGTWPFVAFMLYFITVLAFVTLRGWRSASASGKLPGNVRWRFLFLHAGLLVAACSAFWGAPDSKTLKVQAFKDVPVSEAISEDGRREWLDFELALEDFCVSFGADGMPSDYEAIVAVNQERITLRVNHPYFVSFGTDLYLSGYDTAYERYCIFQIVSEPWRYGAAAGIVMMLTGAFMLFIGGPRRRINENK